MSDWRRTASEANAGMQALQERGGDPQIWMHLLQRTGVVDSNAPSIEDSCMSLESGRHGCSNG
jgi:hypothetical protein